MLWIRLYFNDTETFYFIFIVFYLFYYYYYYFLTIPIEFNC